MHVHANYSQQLASLGASREETKEISARRAAEVRRKLSAVSGALLNEIDEEVTGVPPQPEKRQNPEHREPEEGDFGRLFSARA